MNEILNNEEIIVDVIEETAGMGKAGKFAIAGAIVAAVCGAGVVAYRKIKAKKEQRKAEGADMIIVDESDVIDYEEE